MSIDIFINDNEFLLPQIKFNISKNTTFTNLKNLYFEKVDISPKYIKNNFYFFRDSTKIEFDKKISDYFSNLNYVYITLMYDYENTFSDYYNKMILITNKKMKNKVFCIYISYLKTIMELKDYVYKNYVKNADSINIDKYEKFHFIFYGSHLKTNTLLEKCISGNSIYCILV